jgi:N-acetylmuramoyl-L-alanine amidase
MRRLAAVLTAAALVPLAAAGAGAQAAATPAPAVVAAVGPTPSTWEGGKPVPVAPRWWPQGTSKPSAAWASGWPKPVAFAPTAKGELSGRKIALDPGHALGNSLHLSAINRTYWVGLTKTCNTSGTATNAGYPESSYAFDVVARLRRLLAAHGATVYVTRDRNTTSTYGPCVGARGSFAAQQGADLMVSVHGDGAPSTGRGFHVIAPAYYKGYTDDISTASRTLAWKMISGLTAGGLTPTTYLSSPLSVRKDVGTLNMSDVPTVMVETLNMRNAADARIASTATGRQRMAQGLYYGIVKYLRTVG